jgi:hypothetical protein
VKEHNSRIAEWVILTTIIASAIFSLIVIAHGIVYEDLIALIMASVMIISLTIAVVVHFHIWKTYHHICPECLISFKPTFITSMCAVNMVDLRMMRCPHCGCYKPMKALRDEYGSK